MAVPKGYPLTACRYCDTPIRHRSELSATGLCPECGETIVRENVTQLVAHRGPRFEYWRRRMAETFRYVLDNVPEPEG